MQDVFWLTSPHQNWAVLTRPRGGDWLELDLQRWQRAGLEVIVSMLTPEENRELELEEEGAWCRRLGLEFLAMPLEDRQVPSSSKEWSLVWEKLSPQKKLASTVARDWPIHFVSRLGAGGGRNPEAAWRILAEARQRSVPDTDEQRQWLERG